jgi:hypothetical protein
MEKFLVRGMFALLVAGASGAYAADVPITPSQEGFQNVEATGFPNLICPADVASLGCGGAFQENIASGLNQVQNATIWCVDSQLDVTQSESYVANVQSLATTPASTFDQTNTVRYGGITSSGSGGWIYSLSGYSALSGDSPDNALTRYELAAILISQYIPSDGAPANNAENQSIQDAIWHLTENGSVSTQPNLTGAINVDAPGSGDWIAYAASILNGGGFNFSQWAVVSGGYNCPGGTLTLANCTLDAPSSGGAVQTFLVQVTTGTGGGGNPTPEPRFDSMLLVGMLGLFGIVCRFRRHRGGTPTPNVAD